MFFNVVGFRHSKIQKKGDAVKSASSDFIGGSACADAPPGGSRGEAGLRPHIRSPGDKKKGDSHRGISPIFGGQNYFAASTVSAAASAAVESACSQQAAVESHFSAQPSQAEASVAAASVAAASAAAFLLAFPPQLTMATAARTMTKEKIFFIASNVLNINTS